MRLGDVRAQGDGLIDELERLRRPAGLGQDRGHEIETGRVVRIEHQGLDAGDLRITQATGVQVRKGGLEQVADEIELHGIV